MFQLPKKKKKSQKQNKTKQKRRSIPFPQQCLQLAVKCLAVEDMVPN